MPLLLLIATATLPSVHAAPLKPAGKVAVSGVVEVPLYAGFSGEDRSSYVEATVGEKKLLLRLASSSRDFRLTEAALGKLGLKATGKDGEKKAKLASFTLGGATFEAVTVHVADLTAGGGLPVDGEIGLPGFAGLAWAVVPSAGVLRLATGADGAPLVAAVGTPNAGYGAADKAQKFTIGHSTEEPAPATFVVPVTWSGVEVRAQLQIEAGGTWLAREIEGVDWYSVPISTKVPLALPAAPGFMDGEKRQEWRDIGIGGSTTPTFVSRRGQGPVFAFDGVTNAQVGNELLSGMDLALDPSSATWAIQPAGSLKRGDYGPTHEAALREALVPKPLAKGAEAPSEADLAKARAGGLAPLAAYLESRGRFNDAIAARKEIASVKADDCAALLALGAVHLSSGAPADAVEALTQAGSLYQPWAALSLADRKRITEEKGKAEKDKQPWTGQAPQSHSCHTAPGLLALAQLQVANPAAVTALYPAQLDLDAGLPMAAGNVALLAGQFDNAKAAYFQALKLRGGDDDAARVGLYLSLAPGDFAAARQHLERLRLRFDGATDPMLVRLYVEGVRKSQDTAAVRTALDALLAISPGDAVLLTATGREQAAAGDAAGAAITFATARTRFDASLASAPQNAASWAAYAGFLLATGQTADAQTAADTAVKLAPASGMAWLAVADVAAAAGDAAKAGESRRHAGRVWASHPAYALLLAP